MGTKTTVYLKMGIYQLERHFHYTCWTSSRVSLALIKLPEEKRKFLVHSGSPGEAY